MVRDFAACATETLWLRGAGRFWMLNKPGFKRRLMNGPQKERFVTLQSIKVASGTPPLRTPAAELAE